MSDIWKTKRLKSPRGILTTWWLSSRSDAAQSANFCKHLQPCLTSSRSSSKLSSRVSRFTTRGWELTNKKVRKKRQISWRNLDGTLPDNYLSQPTRSGAKSLIASKDTQNSARRSEFWINFPLDTSCKSTKASPISTGTISSSTTQRRNKRWLGHCILFIRRAYCRLWAYWITFTGGMSTTRRFWRHNRPASYNWWSKRCDCRIYEMKLILRRWSCTGREEWSL